MSDSSSDSCRKCGYCGSYHTYSEIMCRDNFSKAGIEPHDDCTDLRRQLAAARLENDGLRRLLWMARANWCPIDSAAKSALEREVDATLSAPADDLIKRMKGYLQHKPGCDKSRYESTTIGAPVVCTCGLDALLAEIRRKTMKAKVVLGEFAWTLARDGGQEIVQTCPWKAGTTDCGQACPHFGVEIKDARASWDCDKIILTCGAGTAILCDIDDRRRKL